MKENMEERAERLALYIIENRTTVRAAAQKFGISKSTVHTVVLIGVAGIIALSLRLKPLCCKGKRVSENQRPALLFSLYRLHDVS